MPSCCVAYCQSDSRCNTSLVSFFGVPKDPSLFEEWKKVIPIKRKALNPKSLVCQLHFQEQCIKKTNRKHGPRRLKTGSIPTLRLTPESNHSHQDTENQASLSMVFSVPGGLIVLKQKNTSNDENRSLCMDQLKLPGESWRSVKLSLEPVVRKTALINFETKEIEYKVFQRKCPPLNTFLLTTFSSSAQLESSLQYFDCVRTCPGITDEKFHELKEFIFPFEFFEKGTWRSDSCLQLVAAVKQKTEDDLLKSACSKCNKMLRTTLQPHLDKTKQSPANVFKNQYLPREALLAKLTDLQKQNRTLELALKRQEEPEMVMADVLEVEMFQPIDNDEQVAEERPPGNKKMKYLRKNSD
ncbi:uncharacterized protein LOC124342752 isoform X2 [Daphnia pulicaria]|uniref:uncharacterized protein LOC124342752 isoform X2 n=1 Tax=Daphnia pulicaria TaxID=35523 RepID=UPI001EEC90E1|nr:uncharacterized protein LOC124342752 isoform X2 [Daphnia pulicaria]